MKGKMNNKELLLAGAEELGINLSAQQIEELLAYKDIVVEVNQSMNLTSITEDRDFIVKHFLDSFTIGKAIDFTKVYRVLDMGTGAGFPGVPLKVLYPNISFVLADSLNKRIQFLKDTTEKIGLSKIDCIHGRAEDLGQDPKYRESFDVVVSRAVANLAVLAEYCIPFLKVNGTFLCLKGPNYEEELKESKKALRLLGGEMQEIVEVKLPFSDIVHYILVIKKTKQTPTKFPRKPGKPTKSPIK